MDESHLRRAVGEFEARLRVVPAGAWHDPTPCAEWDVHTLVNHVVGELAWIPPLTAGQTIAEVGDRLDGDLLGDDPVGACRDFSAAAIDAASAPGVDERTVHLSFGDVPGREYLDQVTSDITIHTWDLARAVGADERLDDDLVDAVHEYLAPQAELWRGAGVFAEAVATPPDATRQARLLGLTGRAP